MSNSFSHLVGVGPEHTSTTTSLALVVHVLTRETDAVVDSCTITSCGKLPVVSHLVVWSLLTTSELAITQRWVCPAKTYPSRMLLGGKSTSKDVTAVTCAPSSSNARSMLSRLSPSDLMPVCEQTNADESVTRAFLGATNSTGAEIIISACLHPSGS